MTTEVLLPKIGFSMAEGTVTEWLVADGDTVTEGQPIYSLESDKSINEVEAPASGVLRIFLHPSDEPIPVGTKVAEIG